MQSLPVVRGIIQGNTYETRLTHVHCEQSDWPGKVLFLIIHFWFNKMSGVHVNKVIRHQTS